MNLHVAALQGDIAGVRDLLESKVDVDARRGDGGGWTPLHVAAGKGNAPIVEVLIAANADPGAVDSDGRTPLQWAEKAGHRNTVMALRWRVAGLHPRSLSKVSNGEDKETEAMAALAAEVRARRAATETVSRLECALAAANQRTADVETSLIAERATVRGEHDIIDRVQTLQEEIQVLHHARELHSAQLGAQRSAAEEECSQQREEIAQLVQALLMTRVSEVEVAANVEATKSMAERLVSTEEGAVVSLRSEMGAEMATMGILRQSQEHVLAAVRAELQTEIVAGQSAEVRATGAARSELDSQEVAAMHQAEVCALAAVRAELGTETAAVGKAARATDAACSELSSEGVAMHQAEAKCADLHAERVVLLNELVEARSEIEEHRTDARKAKDRAAAVSRAFGR